MSGAGKGPRIKGVNTKALRTGYEGINWTKRRIPTRPWICSRCGEPISDADFTATRASVLNIPGVTPRAAHHDCVPTYF